MPVFFGGAHNGVDCQLLCLLTPDVSVLSLPLDEFLLAAYPVHAFPDDFFW